MHLLPYYIYVYLRTIFPPYRSLTISRHILFLIHVSSISCIHKGISKEKADRKHLLPHYMHVYIQHLQYLHHKELLALFVVPEITAVLYSQGIGRPQLGNGLGLTTSIGTSVNIHVAVITSAETHQTHYCVSDWSGQGMSATELGCIPCCSHARPQNNTHSTGSLQHYLLHEYLQQISINL